MASEMKYKIYKKNDTKYLFKIILNNVEYMSLNLKNPATAVCLRVQYLRVLKAMGRAP